jgi:integrase
MNADSALHPDAQPSVRSSAPTSTVLPRGLTAEDLERIALALEAELATSTQKVYASAWRRWQVWCQHRGLVPLPADPDAICAYLAERAETGIGYGSIDLACSAIGYQHRHDGLPDPTADPTVRRVRRGLRRLLGTAADHPAHPITLAEVRRILAGIDPATPIGIRDRALILFGFASALRPSELAALRLRDVILRPAGLLVVIRRSKTDPGGRGQIIGVAPGQHPGTDPVAALAAWTQTRPTGPGPLFAQIDPAGAATRQPITGVTVSRIVRRRALAAGLLEQGISGQSLRAGHATTAAVNGASVDRIAAQTRHRALDTLIEHYIRPADALARTTSRDLGL